MLSGKVPFQPEHYTNQSALSVMKSIMQGVVSFKDEEWNGVSLSAKSLIQGIKYINVYSGFFYKKQILFYYLYFIFNFIIRKVMHLQ
jgi:hypothetical protein